MDDFDELIPGSPVARRRGCTCSISAGPQFKADPACPKHGVAIFKRLLQSPEGKSAIERFRRRLDEAREEQSLVAGY